jgi:ribose 1,5-bisphosphokinase
MRGGPGQLVAVVGPSGSGKDTLLGGLVRARPDIHWARRTISRPPSAETEPFESVSAAEFAALCAVDAFALHWPAHGLTYGIRHAELVALGQSRTVVFNGSRKALLDAAARFPALRVIAITVPPEVLAARLAARGRESADDIARRLDRAAYTLPEGLNAQVISNDDTPEVGIARLIAALQPISA